MTKALAPPDVKRQLPVAAALCAYVVFVLSLATGPFAVGPSEWDDAMYCDRAATGELTWELRNRYVHIWVIRLLSTMFDSRIDGASFTAAILVAAIGIVACAGAARQTAWFGGVIALASATLFPPMLRYLTAPHVDYSMALWSLLAVVFVVIAIEGRDSSGARVAATLCGLSTFLALESKETGLAVLAVTGYLFTTESQTGRRRLGYWIAGMACGWALLLCLDLLFRDGNGWLSANPLHYFDRAGHSEAPLALPPPEGPTKFKLQKDFLGQLTSPEFMAFTLMGLAGLARGFRKHLLIRALGLWAIAVTVLTAYVAWRSARIQIYDRYLIAHGAAFASLIAYWIHSLWSREPSRPRREELLWLMAVLIPTVGVSGWGLWGTGFGADTQLQKSAVVFVVPVTLTLLFLVPWFVRGRLVPTLAAGVLLAMSGLASISTASARVAEGREEMAPWRSLAAMLDRERAKLAVWDAPLMPARRVLWRTRLLSRREPHAIEARGIAAPSEVRGGEWIFTSGASNEKLEASGWRRRVHSEPKLGGRHARRFSWSVYSR